MIARAVCSLALVLLSSHAAHPGPPVYIEVEVGEREVVLRFTGEQATWNRWLGRAEPDTSFFSSPLGESELDWLRPALGDFLAAVATITVDTAVGEPSLTDLQVPEEDINGYGVPALSFALRYPVSDSARRIDLRWQRWDGLEWFDGTKLPVQFKADGDLQIAFLTPEEPGHSWRPREFVPRERPPIAPIAAAPAPVWRVPLASIAVVLAALAAGICLLRAKAGSVALAIVGLSGLSTAWLLRGVATIEVSDPFHREVERPAPPEAAAILDSLLRNVYSAFDARSEGEIYDLLSVSVAPEMIDETYGEVYESLIMRGEAGAVCQVEHIDVLEREMLPDTEYKPWDLVPDGREDDPFFKMRWKWEVHGVVAHWGHEHRRVNAYEAIYTVRHDPVGWRIGACEIVDRSRIDRDG